MILSWFAILPCLFVGSLLGSCGKSDADNAITTIDNAIVVESATDARSGTTSHQDGSSANERG